MMSLSLNLQLFRCKKEMIKQVPFDKISKRNILYPFTFNYTDKKNLKLADIQNFILKNCSTKLINIDKIVAKISFTDIILFQNITRQNE